MNKIRRMILLITAVTFSLVGCSNEKSVELLDEEMFQTELIEQVEDTEMNVQTVTSGDVSGFPTESGYEHTGDIEFVEKVNDTYIIHFIYVTVPMNIPLTDVQNFEIGQVYVFPNGCEYKVLGHTEEGYILAEPWYNSIEQAFAEAMVVYCVDEEDLTYDGNFVRVYNYASNSIRPMEVAYRSYTSVRDVTAYIDGEAVVYKANSEELKVSEIYEKVENNEFSWDMLIQFIFKCDELGKVTYLKEWYGAG